MKVFSGSSNKPLAEKIASNLGLQLSPIEIFVFPDGERRIRIEESVVDQDTIIVQPTATPVDQNYMELFFIADALKRSGARSITLIVPYLGYQRQDHVFRDGEAVSLNVVINVLQAMGINWIISFDFHTIKTPEIFSIPVSHLSALPLFAQEIRKILGDKETSGSSVPSVSSETSSILVSPDMGGLRRIKIMSEMVGMPWIATVKNRDLTTGHIEISKIEGEIPTNTKKAFIVDDMASSGKTLVRAAQLLKERGIDEIYAFITHPIFSIDAPLILQNSEIKKIFVTDSVFVPEDKKFEKLEILSIAEMIGVEIKGKS